MVEWVSSVEYTQYEYIFLTRDYIMSKDCVPKESDNPLLHACTHFILAVCQDGKQSRSKYNYTQLIWVNIHD